MEITMHKATDMAFNGGNRKGRDVAVVQVDGILQIIREVAESTPQDNSDRRGRLPGQELWPPVEGHGICSFCWKVGGRHVDDPTVYNGNGRWSKKTNNDADNNSNDNHHRTCNDKHRN